MKKVLIIEDDKIIKGIIEFVLRNDGYNFENAPDGLIGLEKITSFQPDLVITDIMLPYKSGLEIIMHAKTNNPKTPIIVISSLGKEESTVSKALKLGATDILAKPFNPIELKSKVRTFFTE